jgi:hypothetical protein
MKPLSQSEYGELRSLYESVYAPKFESILDEFTDEDLDDLTEEYIEEQVNEFFQECVEEGLDIDIIEETICESIDSSLELLSEVTNPAKVAAARMRDKASGGDKPKMNVSKQKVGGSSEKKASKLSMVKGAVKKAAKAVQGGVGLAARAVGTAQRAGSAVKSAAKKGYERGRQGSGGESSSSGSSDSSSSSGGGSSSSGSSGTSSASGGGSSSGSSPAPKKRKDGLLKRAIKKVVRGVSKGVSAAAGAVKAGADSVTDRARKEELEATGLFSEKEIAAIEEYVKFNDGRKSRVTGMRGEFKKPQPLNPLPKSPRKSGMDKLDKGRQEYNKSREVASRNLMRQEEYVDEALTGARAQRARQMQDSEVKKGGGKRTPADRDTAFRLGTGTGPGRVSDRPIKKQSWKQIHLLQCRQEEKSVLLLRESVKALLQLEGTLVTTIP